MSDAPKRSTVAALIAAVAAGARGPFGVVGTPFEITVEEDSVGDPLYASSLNKDAPAMTQATFLGNYRHREFEGVPDEADEGQKAPSTPKKKAAKKRASKKAPDKSGDEDDGEKGDKDEGDDETEGDAGDGADPGTVEDPQLPAAE